jgi:hypothetical protein
MKYGRYGVSAIANPTPDAPRIERATGKTQQLKGKTEKNAETSEKPLATDIVGVFIGKLQCSPNCFVLAKLFYRRE